MTIITDPVPESQLGPVTHDDRTSGGLPLPHPDNSARRDAVRLRAALILLESRLTGVITEIQVQGLIDAAVADLLDSAPGALDTLNELASAIGDDPNFAATVMDAIALKAPKDSPTLTGTPLAPTGARTLNNTQIATTAWVKLVLANMGVDGLQITVPTAPVDDNDTSPASTAFVLAQAATGTLLRALASTTRFVTPKAMADAMAFVTEAASATIAPDFSLGFNRLYTMGLNATLGQPTNMKDGEPVVLYFQQDATGGRTLSFSATYHKFTAGVVPTLSTAANAIDRLAGICRNRGGTLVVEWGTLEKDIK